MKKSVTWRLLLLVVGMMLGLLAGLGVSAPASADTGTATVAENPDKGDRDKDRDHDGDRDRDKGDRDDKKRDRDRDRGDRHDSDAELSLEFNRNGRYEVDGDNYDARRVHVWIVKVSGRDRVVDYERVRVDDGEFDFDGKVRCGETYQAVSYSHDDGWVKSDKEKARCNNNRH